MTLDARSIHLRKLVLRMVNASRRGHIGSAYSMIEILRVLYDDGMMIFPQDPEHPNRDRLILSKGNGCLAQYALLVDKGYVEEQHADSFCHLDGLFGGHPEPSIPGVEFATGSLGHGLSLGIGMALAGRIDHLPYRTFVILGDGECDEGSIWEAALSAGNHHLDTLVALVDYNHMQSYGHTSEVMDLEPFAKKWESFGWEVTEIDGHDTNAIRRALKKIPIKKEKPTCLICHTIKGKGIPSIEQNPSWHHKRGITDEEMKQLYEELEMYNKISSSNNQVPNKNPIPKSQIPIGT